VKPLRAVFAVASLGVGAIAIACGPAFLEGISGGTRETEPDAEASVPPPVDARACQPRRLPDPPPGEDDKVSLALPTFAFESLRVDAFGAPDAGGAIPVGLDLDDRCTCPETDSCIRPPGGDAGQVCDGKNGEDNAVSGLFNALNIGIPLFQQTFATDGIRLGLFTLLVDVLGWNGQDNDPRVTVTMRLSLRIDGPKTDAGLPRPKFDGTDVWTLDPNAISGGVESVGKDCRVPSDSYKCLGRVRDDRAFVRDGKLVSHPRLDAKPDAPVRITILASAGAIHFDILDFSLYGTLNRGADGRVTSISGEASGRVTSSNVLESFGTLQDFTSSKDTPVCQNPAVFNIAKTSVCKAADLAAPGKDNTGAACDHLSLALSFTASSAIVGPIFLKDTAAAPCDESIFTCP
jgi:hypothetical protein